MGFSFVFWGLLIGLIADVIPHQNNVIGLVSTVALFLGLRQLSLFNMYFSWAKNYLIVSFILSVCTILLKTLFIESLVSHWRLVENGANLVVGLITLLVIYYLCKGITEMAQEYEKPEISVIVRERWNYYLYFSIVSLVVSINIFPIPLIGLFMLVMSIVVNLLLIGLIKQVQKAFRFLRPPNAPTHH